MFVPFFCVLCLACRADLTPQPPSLNHSFLVGKGEYLLVHYASPSQPASNRQGEGQTGIGTPPSQRACERFREGGWGVRSRIDAALAKAARFLVKKQSPEGAWRSKVYGFFKDGSALTPLVLNALYFLPQGGDKGKEAFRRGTDYLEAMVGADGTIQTGPRGLNFPVLTAGAAVRIFSLAAPTPAARRAEAAWLAYLKKYRLSGDLGWKPEDTEFGGWGFSLLPPRKPAPGEPKPPFCESNLVATIYGILGLRSAQTPPSDPAYAEALAFVERCQNFAADPDKADPAFDDGGFVFIPDDPVQNKAGIAGKDRFGRTRYHSYGSMTADGLRALIRCGLPPDHPRVIAARKWLERNFSVVKMPGKFNPDREALRAGHYYYWCWAVAHAFLALNVREIETKAGKVPWAEALAEEMLRRQRPDGSWANRYTAANEDDPLVATPWAAATLAICRVMLTTEKPP